MILGQEKIMNRIESATLDSFPRTLMLVGPKGSGKHLIADQIAVKFSLMSADITDKLTQEEIEELYNRVEPYLYLIRVNEITVKEENTILKFIEEPLKNAYVVLLAETDLGILDTILNRCQIWPLQPYDHVTLKEFLTNSNQAILSIAETPGQVIELCNTNVTELFELADKIVRNIAIASVANTLTLSGKVGFKNDSTKPDVKLLLKTIKHILLEYCKRDCDRKYFTAWMITAELDKRLSVKNLDHKLMFEKYLIELRQVMRGELT